MEGHTYVPDITPFGCVNPAMASRDTTTLELIQRLTLNPNLLEHVKANSDRHLKYATMQVNKQLIHLYNGKPN